MGDQKGGKIQDVHQIALLSKKGNEMRKISFICLALACALLTAAMANAAGRLNFMLINLTGQDIVDARICPTYYPNYISENLLKTPLDPDTRIYIGPNYYGDQKFWNIQLTWANGYQHTFTHTRLTRYNTYVAYVTPYGVKLRQTYEPAFARYDFSPSVPTYAAGSPNMNVAVSAPEKVNVTQQPKAVADASNVTQRKRATRDLVFEDEEETAPTVAGSAADEVKGDTIAMKATVEMTRDGKTTTVLPTEDFRSGDKVRLIFSTNKDGHIYWLAKGTSGQYQVLFPTAKTGMDNTVARNKEYTVPTKGAWRFDDQKGTETLVAVLSPKPVADLDKAVKLSAEGDREGASKIVAGIVNGHEKKRTTRDLVFEEEDDQDVNTKSQKSNGDEPFVATYELTHN